MAHMEGDVHVVTIGEALNYIKARPNNTKETPYKIKITGGKWENEEHRTTLKNCAKVLNKFVDFSNTVFEGTFINMHFFFNGCTSLVSAPAVPNGVIDMGYCFNNCTNLVNVFIKSNTVVHMNHCFYGCGSLLWTFIVSTSVTNMSNCFNGCTSLTTTPVIPSSVTNMSNCFSGCLNIVSSYDIPKGVTNMNYCFNGCTRLVKAPFIPNSVTSMSHCFKGCKSIVSAPIIPISVTDKHNCFLNCTKIRSFFLPLKIPDFIEKDRIRFIETLYDTNKKEFTFVENKAVLKKITLPENVSTMHISGKLIYLIGNMLTENAQRRSFIQSCLSTIQEGIKKIKQIRNAVIIGTKDKTNTYIKGVNF